MNNNLPSFTQAELNSDVATIVSGDYTAANFLLIANQAVREVLADLDLRGSKRKTSLSPNLFDEVYQYSCPSTIKGDKIIDIAPQISRTKLDYWTLVPAREFDRYKADGDNLVAITRDDLINKVLISRPVDDDELTIDRLDAVGDWAAFGDGTNLTADADNYVKGSSAINWDINADGGTTAGIVNSSVDSFDTSIYATAGSAFVWVYISSITNLTNFILRIGSSSSAYDYITITTNNEAAAFYAGWNLLRFDFSGKATTGSPTRTACDYVALYMTKDGAKTSETDYRFDNLVLKLGEHWNLSYYCRYLWQSNAGVYLEDATATTDVLNCETDELPLFIRKTAQLMETHLKKHDLADRHESKYKEMKAQYLFDNPSEALLLQQTYFDL